MKKILIIDDEEEFVSFMKTNIELRYDYEVIAALDGETGLRAAESIGPDLVLLDINMPGMNGFEVLKKLRENGKTKAIPVIMVTARTDDETMMEALKLHDDGYVVKPVKIEELEKKMEEALGEE
ncbi:MAG: response regulator [Candidatus Omnitrophica bacterium]|nr:response regulator [Candidatus Omnitrophota bacterium]